MGARWAAITSAVVLGVLGLGSVAAALVAANAPTLVVEAAESILEPQSTARPAPVPSLSGESEPGTEAVVIADLADPTWVTRVSRAGDIPERALAAYAGAALAAQASHPSCGIGWNTIAAIGLVESEHGSMDGGILGPDGNVEPAIIGVALDGVGVEAISDTDGGALDGDTVWDRAVGPMQFIPSTWRVVGKDGNGDGRVSINNIDDAAYSAAIHLCEVGGDLRSSANWIAAISAYNSSVEYNNRVAQVATTYSELR